MRKQHINLKNIQDVGLFLFLFSDLYKLFIYAFGILLKTLLFLSVVENNIFWSRLLIQFAELNIL